MDIVLAFLKALLIPVVLVGGLISLFLWWRSGFWAPRYIHILAHVSGALGLLLAWMAWDSDHPMKEQHVWLAVIFPAIVYVAFGFYGGKVIARHLRDKQRHNDLTD